MELSPKHKAVELEAIRLQFSSTADLDQATHTLNMLWTVVACGFNRNVVIFFKVNPCVACREQLTEENRKNMSGKTPLWI